MDVYVISSKAEPEQQTTSRPPAVAQPFAWQSYLLGAGLVILATFVVADAEYLLTFAGLLAVGLVISTLATRAQDQVLAARRREAQTFALYELSQRLASASGVADIAQTTVNHVQTTFSSPTAIFSPDKTGESLIIQASTSDFEQETDARAVADLASITGSLSGVLDDAHLLSEEARIDLIQTAWEQALRMNRLVGNLLDMTRLESGAMKVVDNAVKYAPVNEPIEIEAYEEQQTVVLAVKDRGAGLPETELENVFNKFFRLQPNGVGGTGLGLSIAKGIVEAHHGRIWVENRPGGGAVFRIALPVAKTDVPPEN